MKLARGLLLPALVAGLTAWTAHEPSAAVGGLRLTLARGPSARGFARATTPRAIGVPKDHGPHFQFQTEWWYYNGHLHDAGGRRFGFQLAFFRRGLTPGPPPPGPGLATNQIYFAHFALTDVDAGRHRYRERAARGAGGLASASATPFVVQLEGWHVRGLNGDGSRVNLAAQAEGAQLELTLAARKPLVVHGERGRMAKGPRRGQASYYASYTRLEARGSLRLDGRRVTVLGQAWFDHEWSSQAHPPGLAGWDWFGLQLGDGRELMFYALRQHDGLRAPASAGTLVDADGRVRRLSARDVEVEALAHWTSSATGDRYPIAWRLRLPGLAIVLELRTPVVDQEMRTSLPYWEGVVEVQGTAGGRPLTGRGYVELTGYGAHGFLEF